MFTLQVVLCGMAVPPELGQAEVARLQLEAGMQRRERDRQVGGRGRQKRSSHSSLAAAQATALQV